MDQPLELGSVPMYQPPQLGTQPAELEIVGASSMPMDQPAELGLVGATSVPNETANIMSISSQTSDPPIGMNQSLYRSARSGNVDRLRKLVRKNPDVLREVTPGGNTALHEAAYHGHHDFVLELLDLSAIGDSESRGSEFVRAKNAEGNTALHEAAMGGHANVVRILVNKYPGLACMTNGTGETALFKAAEEGHASIIHGLLNAMPSEYDMRRSSDGQTPLHCAVFNLREGVILELIKGRPQLVEQVDNNDLTPLHMAAFSCRSAFRVSYNRVIRRIGKMLLEKKDSICYRVDKNGQTPLHIAAKEGNAVLVKEILNCRNDCLQMLDGNGRNALHLAVENAAQIYSRVGRDVKTIISCLMQKRLINCTDKSGRTPLDIATENRELDPHLFIGLALYLQRNGARRMTSTVRREMSQRNSTIISVNAVLIATVTFAVAFTLPGNLASDANGRPTPALLNLSLFKVFVLLDTFALCYSLASAVLLSFAHVYGRIADPVIMHISNVALWVAMVCLGLTFGAGIHLVVAHSCLWLAVAVWVMVCSLPCVIRLYAYRGKRSLFHEPKMYIWMLIKNSLIVPLAVLSPVVWLSYILYAGCIVVPLLWCDRKIKFIRLIKKRHNDLLESTYDDTI